MLLLPKAGGYQNIPEPYAGGDHNVLTQQNATFDVVMCFMQSIVVTKTPWVVLATGLNCCVGSGCGSTRNRTVAPVLTIPNSRTIGNGPLLPPKTRPVKFTILVPIKYLSYNCIMT
jgi:hypothetical protein